MDNLVWLVSIPTGIQKQYRTKKHKMDNFVWLVSIPTGKQQQYRTHKKQTKKT